MYCKLLGHLYYHFQPILHNSNICNFQITGYNQILTKIWYMVTCDRNGTQDSALKLLLHLCEIQWTRNGAGFSRKSHTVLSLYSEKVTSMDNFFIVSHVLYWANYWVLSCFLIIKTVMKLWKKEGLLWKSKTLYFAPSKKSLCDWLQIKVYIFRILSIYIYFYTR